EKTSGRLNALKKKKTVESVAAEKEAFMNAGIEDPVVLIPPACAVHAAKAVLRMEKIVLPYGACRDAIDWVMMGPERVAVEGPNGSGKTTLLQVLMGEIAPLSGFCEIKVPYSVLGQFAELDGERSSMELLLSGSDSLTPGEAGARLAQIGIARERLRLSAKSLSQAAARLPIIDLELPSSVLGKNTREAMQSGIILGEVARVNGLIAMIWEDLGYETKVILTGEDSPLLAPLLACRAFVEEGLTLHGLKLLNSLNRKPLR
ncbi:MAG: type III pantothenate kinase, partial [Coriobacteriaceae bacterium]|nr:type III pantothenate kinase [Coriobacteriaceae bacterium]